MKRFFLAFDISDDKRRSKLTRILENYGTRVQYSIFEFSLSPAKELTLMKDLSKLKFISNENPGEGLLIIPIDNNTSEKVVRTGSTKNFYDNKFLIP
ncbi:MAG: CRISPR-associated endonuclease Cas2 [bacterium]